MTPAQQFTLDGRVALVTGGAGWIGSALCESLGEGGATVYMVDIQEETIDSRVNALREKGINAIGRTADTISERPLIETVDAIAKEAGRLDVLVNCAYRSPSPPINEVEYRDMQEGFEAATAYFVAAKQAAIHMRRTGGGSIINIGSMYGQVTGYPDVYRDLMPPNPLPYQAGKAAVHHMTKYLAVYWADDHIRVNAIAPGPVPNPGAPTNANCERYDEFIERLTERTPLHRVGTPSDFKGPVLFLASDASAFMTGQTLFVDGGWSVW